VVFAYTRFLPSSPSDTQSTHVCVCTNAADNSGHITLDELHQALRSKGCEIPADEISYLVSHSRKVHKKCTRKATCRLPLTLLVW
jgi:hypothetical protein